MLIDKTHYDLPTKLDPNGRPIRIFVISPTVANYPNAKFPDPSLMPTTSSFSHSDAYTQESLSSGTIPVNLPS